MFFYLSPVFVRSRSQPRTGIGERVFYGDCYYSTHWLVHFVRYRGEHDSTSRPYCVTSDEICKNKRRDARVDACRLFEPNDREGNIEQERENHDVRSQKYSVSQLRAKYVENTGVGTCNNDGYAIVYRDRKPYIATIVAFSTVVVVVVVTLNK